MSIWEGLLILQRIIHKVFLFLIRIQLLQEWLVVKIVLSLFIMVLVIKLLELLFAVAANDCTSTNLNGIVLFLHFTVVSLQVILSSLLKTLGALKMLGRRYSSYSCCASRYDIRCVKSIVGLAIAIRGMRMGSDVLDYRMANVIVYLVLVFGLRTLF